VNRALVTALLLVALLALAAAGCGGDDEGAQIPRDQASTLLSRLREADRRINQDPPVCGDLSDDTLPALEDEAANLPEETDEDVKKTVQDGIDHLRSLIDAECAASREERQQEETTTTEEEPPPTTTEEEPPPTTTEQDPPPTQTPPTTPPETPPTTPPDNGNGSGGQGLPDGSVRPKGRNKKDKD
jgi:hypothetical protein